MHACDKSQNIVFPDGTGVFAAKTSYLEIYDIWIDIILSEIFQYVLRYDKMHDKTSYLEKRFTSICRKSKNDKKAYK